MKFKEIKFLVKTVTVLFMTLFVVGCKGSLESTNKISESSVADSNENIIEEVNGTAQLGYLGNAKVEIYEVADDGSFILRWVEYTSNGITLDQIGKFNLHAKALEPSKFYLYKVIGGEDWDANDDGKKDNQFTPNSGTIRAIAKGEDISEIGSRFKVTIVTEIVYEKVEDVLQSDFNSTEFSSILDQESASVIHDINGDNNISVEDIVTFDPIVHKDKLKDTFESKLTEILDVVHQGEKALSIDTTPPTMTIVGDNPMEVSQGTPFIDPGVKVADNVDSNLTVTVVGEVNTSKVGNYTLTYSATDSAGNHATIQRVVNVVDTTPPTMTIVGDNPMEVSQGTPFIDPGVKVTDNIDSNLTVTVVGEVNTSKVGSYTLTYSATDSAGNHATIERIVNVVDTTPPVIAIKNYDPTDISQTITNQDSIDIEIEGEIGAKLYINGVFVEELESNHITVTLDTSGTSGDKSFVLQLKDSAGNSSDEVHITVTKGVVYDQRTHLMWQDDSDTNQLKMVWSEAQNYCEELVIGNYADWRVPSLDELFTITDHTTYNPSIQNGFLYSIASSYWSSSRYSLDQSLLVGINFYDGSDGISYETTPRYVRCVRGEPLQSPLLTQYSSETVLDSRHNLLWQDNEDVETQFLTYEEAVEYCNNLTLSQMNGWRVPTILELRTIIDRNYVNSATHQAFQYRVDGFVWSSTVYQAEPTKMWTIFFGDGNDYQQKKDSKGYVRCVKETS